MFFYCLLSIDKFRDTCSYSVNNRNFSVLLKQKMDLTKENGAPVKKLKK